MTMGLPCDREGYDLRMTPCPKCGSRGCPQLHRNDGKCSADKPAVVPERLNPLLKLEALQAADEAACRLDGMFRDLFNNEERMDLIVTIIRAATSSMLGVAVSSTPRETPHG